MSSLASLIAQVNSTSGAGGAAFGIGMIVLFVAIGIACFVFWLWMLIDILSSSRPSNEKLLWALVIVITGILGAIIYFFVGRGGSTSATRTM